jgi:hypothetical protein
MSLFGVAPSFGYCTDNLTGTPSATPGTLITASSTANVKGNTTRLFQNVANDIHYMVIAFNGSRVSGVDSSMLADIMVDPTGSAGSSPDLYYTFISNLLCGYLPLAASDGPLGAVVYHFPIYLKMGATIGCRAQSANVSNIVRCMMWLYGEPRRPQGWWCGSRVETIGITTSRSGGVLVTTPAAAGVFSNWTAVGNVTRATGALQFGAQGGQTITIGGGTQFSYEFGIGTASPDVTAIISPKYEITCSTDERYTGIQPSGPLFTSLASGSLINARCVNGGVTHTVDVAAYAVQ